MNQNKYLCERLIESDVEESTRQWARSLDAKPNISNGLLPEEKLRSKVSPSSGPGHLYEKTPTGYRL